MKPILFNTDMVRALLEGRKTVTRRVIKPQPKCYRSNITHPKHKEELYIDEKTGWLRCRGCGYSPQYSREGTDVSHYWEPPYHPGDVLYVREAWAEMPYGYVYRADDKCPEGWECDDRWKPSIHMPKELARLFLRVKSVKVQRLRQITDEEAVHEGIRRMFDNLSDEEYANWAGRIGERRTKEEWGWENYLWHGNIGENGITGKMSDSWQYQMSGYDRPRDSFSSLWNSTLPLEKWNEYGWEANPYVWVIEFENVSQEEAVTDILY